MIRVRDIDGAVESRFSNGSPSLGVAATIVDETWLNAVQEELASVIESQGLELSIDDESQLLQAVTGIVRDGGVITRHEILNDIQEPAEIDGYIFDAGAISSATFDFEIERTTSEVEIQETGTVRLVASSAGWRVSVSSSFDDCGVVFSVGENGNLAYTSTFLSGENHISTLAIHNKKEMKL